VIKEIFEIIDTSHVSSGKFSISSIDCCLRKKYLEMKGLYKEKYDSKTLRTFALGDLFHRQAVKEILEKSDKLNLHVVASEVNIPEQKYFSGRADLVVSNSITGELYVIDVKSAGDYTMKLAKEGKVSDSYIKQMQLYLHFFKLKTGYILFYGKHKGEIFEVEVKYDKELCEKTIKIIEDFFLNNIEKNIEPEKCFGRQFGCKACDESTQVVL